MRQMAARLAAIVCLCAVAVLRWGWVSMPHSSGSMPQWMDRAAAASQQASGSPCSGHGRVFEDSIGLACECSDCYAGVDCSQFQEECMIDADGGDPTFLEPYWTDHGPDAGLFIPSWYRLSYSIQRKDLSRAFAALPLSYVSKELEDNIRDLHQLVGNAITKDKYIIIGTGSMQLVAAAVNALSDSLPGKPATVVTRYPYYMLYKYQVDVLSSSKFKWGGDAVEFFENQAFDPSSVIELVASPNNPDTSVLEPVYNGTKAKIIHDKAYYWPHYTAITGALDEDVMLFSLSKSTGHAGSRIGWALVRDFEIYKKMFMYVAVTTIGVSRESQLRASRLLKATLDGYRTGKTGLFHFGYDVLQQRWQRLAEIFKDSTKFTMQKIDSQHCNFLKKQVSPSPAYAWIRCEHDEDEDCNSLFISSGITGRPGREFGVSTRYVRLCLIKRDDQFDLLVAKLRKLVKNE